MMYKVLLIDDEQHILDGRSLIIEDLGFTCFTAQNGKEALSIVRKKKPDIVLSDVKMDELDGFGVLSAVKELDAGIPVILFTGHASVEDAVKAIQMGADDYIQKPVMPELLAYQLKNVKEKLDLRRENELLRSQSGSADSVNKIIGKSNMMEDLSKRIRKIAKSSASVLIYGESGTGKELIAQSIHDNSLRKDAPFIPLDCVALPPTLIESELFGYEKGAFTGAVDTKPGIIELANEGTLFLDEITELHINLQAKLLRVLQERKFRRVGGRKTLETDIRIISATNINPEKAVQDGQLRKDLYYRLNVVPIFAPPLRERRIDIPLLVHHFLTIFEPLCHNAIKGIEKDAMQKLADYSWPGNVRELQNVIEQAMVTAESEYIRVTDLPPTLRELNSLKSNDISGNISYKEAKKNILDEFHAKYLSTMMKKYNGNISMIAKIMGLSRSAVYRIMKDAGIY